MSTKEIVALAKAHGFDLNKAEAVELSNRFANGELNDHELEAIAGGKTPAGAALGIFALGKRRGAKKSQN